MLARKARPMIFKNVVSFLYLHVDFPGGLVHVPWLFVSEDSLCMLVSTICLIFLVSQTAWHNFFLISWSCWSHSSRACLLTDVVSASDHGFEGHCSAFGPWERFWQHCCFLDEKSFWDLFPWSHGLSGAESCSALSVQGFFISRGCWSHPSPRVFLQNDGMSAAAFDFEEYDCAFDPWEPFWQHCCCWEERSCWAPPFALPHCFPAGVVESCPVLSLHCFWLILLTYKFLDKTVICLKVLGRYLTRNM